MLLVNYSKYRYNSVPKYICNSTPQRVSTRRMVQLHVLILVVNNQLHWCLLKLITMRNYLVKVTSISYSSMEMIDCNIINNSQSRLLTTIKFSSPDTVPQLHQAKSIRTIIYNFFDESHVCTSPKSKTNSPKQVAVFMQELIQFDFHSAQT